MPPRLEEFLQSEPHTIDRIELLADYYRYTEQYEQAAYTFGWLAENRQVQGKGVIEDTG